MASYLVRFGGLAALIACTIGTFIFMQTIAFDGLRGSIFMFLYRQGALEGEMLSDPRWPRSLTMLWTHGFLHIGALHIAVNMVPLAILGTVAVLRVGLWRFLLLYFAGMAISGLLWGLLNPNGSLVGASGAINVVWGAVAAWAVIDRARPQGLGLAAGWVLAALALNAWFVSLRGWDFAWDAHLLGFALGALAAPFIVHHPVSSAPPGHER